VDIREAVDQVAGLGPWRSPRRGHTRGSDWKCNFHLKDAPSLGKILIAEKKAG